VYRSTDGTIDLNRTRIATFTDINTTNFTDNGLAVGSTYYYGVYVVDTNGVYSLSANIAQATTTAIPWSAFTNATKSLDSWSATGSWGLDTNNFFSPPAALTDSPGTNYSINSDTELRTSLDLTGIVWPVLKFKDWYRVANGDYGFVEVSRDGNSWTRLYGANGVSTNWTEHAIDLSEWKNHPNLRLRLHMVSDGSGVDAGWSVDDMLVVEHPPVSIPAPCFDGYENGFARWIKETWQVDTNVMRAGAAAARQTVLVMAPDVVTRLTLAGSVNLLDTTDPELTFWVKGHIWNSHGHVGVQVSTDGGLTWPEPWGVADGWNYPDWTQVRLSLNSWKTANVRVRFIYYSYWGGTPDMDMVIDNVGIGDQAPGAPWLCAPGDSNSVAVLRPTFSVTNAVDAQGDTLTYRFEVFSNPTLTNLVAQVPVVASGSNVTAWQVDVDLLNNAQYWWRCRASDGTNVGAWMATASFFVRQINHPPPPVVIAMPDGQVILTDTNDVLTWYPASDPDEGDYIRAYHVQADTSSAFTSPLINDANIVITNPPVPPYGTISVPLGRFAGAQNLVSGTTYYWRIRAQDSWLEWSAWNSGEHSFRFGTAVVPQSAHLSGIRMGESGIVLEWGQATGQIFVEFSPTLSPPAWTNVAGPLTGTNWTHTPWPGTPSGFYRLRSE
jgi:hypothetical protein